MSDLDKEQYLTRISEAKKSLDAIANETNSVWMLILYDDKGVRSDAGMAPGLSYEEATWFFMQAVVEVSQLYVNWDREVTVQIALNAIADAIVSERMDLEFPSRGNSEAN